MARAGAPLLVVCALAACACCAPRADAAAPTFQRCADAVAQRPADYESYRCYYEVASSSGDWQIAARELDALRTARPAVDWIVFVRALVTWPVDKTVAERLYREAVRRFEAAGNIRGAVLARANLHSLLYDSGHVASAAREMERIAELASRTDEPEIRIRARIVEAQFFITTGSNLGRAQRALKQAEADLEAIPSYWLRHHVLHGLGNVLFMTGQYDEALSYFRRLEQEAAAQPDLSTVAIANLSIVNTLVEKRNEAPPSVDVNGLLSEAQRALDTARRSKDIDLELNALRLLGEVLMPKHGDRAHRYVAECVQKAREQQRSQMLSQCLWIRARLVAASDPVGARSDIDAAIALLQHEEGTDQAMLAYAWRHAMRIAWQIQSPAEAIESGTRALTAIERLRDLQPGLDSRAAAFSTWTRDYYWLSGQILRAAQHAESASRRDLINAAFRIGEQMRARTLLDRLKAPATPLVAEDDTAVLRRNALLKSIVQVNRELLQSRGRPTSEQLQRLAALERSEADVRELRDASQVSLEPVSLADAQRVLDPDEALLVFQMGLRQGAADRFAGGAWVFVLTARAVHAFELPDRYALSQSIALYEGLVRQSASLRGRAGTALFDRVLREALSSLPGSVRRIIVVPDAPLDTFPLSALSATPDGDPLAKRYEIVLEPSVTIWHDWRENSKRIDSRNILVMADPTMPFDGATFSLASMQRSKAQLGALPRARAEGVHIRRYLHGRGTVWAGNDASEAALKATDLSGFAVLHFATHSVVDEIHPERSAVLLAAGTKEQDGLLQSREIPDLAIRGSAVVLSSCQSATGARVRGEGVLSLARSFFAGGARAVIGSLWPIRDDHAQAFFDAFYEALGRGHTLSAAFHIAQRRLIDGAYPVEAWAGFVLIGDGSTALVAPEAVRDGSEEIWVAAIGGVMVALGVVTRLLVRSRRDGGG